LMARLEWSFVCDQNSGSWRIFVVPLAPCLFYPSHPSRSSIVTADIYGAWVQKHANNQIGRNKIELIDHQLINYPICNPMATYPQSNNNKRHKISQPVTTLVSTNAKRKTGVVDTLILHTTTGVLPIHSLSLILKVFIRFCEPSWSGFRTWQTYVAGSLTVSLESNKT
jgi:hypothetical protein